MEFCEGFADLFGRVDGPSVEIYIVLSAGSGVNPSELTWFTSIFRELLPIFSSKGTFKRPAL